MLSFKTELYLEKYNTLNNFFSPINLFPYLLQVINILKIYSKLALESLFLSLIEDSFPLTWFTPCEEFQGRSQ